MTTNPLHNPASVVAEPTYDDDVTPLRRESANFTLSGPLPGETVAEPVVHFTENNQNTETLADTVVDLAHDTGDSSADYGGVAVERAAQSAAPKLMEIYGDVAQSSEPAADAAADGPADDGGGLYGDLKSLQPATASVTERDNIYGDVVLEDAEEA